MAVKPPISSGSERQDAAFVDAYVRRVQGLATTGLSPQEEAEIDGYIALHDRVARLDLPDVAPSVRSVVLSAAAQAITEREKALSLKHFLLWLLRPGPAVIVMTAAAIAVAVAVRPHVAQAPDPSERPTAEVSTALNPEAVAMMEPAAHEAAPAAPAAVLPPPTPANDAPVAGSPAPAPHDAPLHTIAAQPASLGPQEAPPAAAATRRVAEAKPFAPPKEKIFLSENLDEVRSKRSEPTQAALSEKNQFNQAPVAAKAPASPAPIEAEIDSVQAQAPAGQAGAKAGPSYRFQDDLADRTAAMAPSTRGANNLGNAQRAQASVPQATVDSAADVAPVNPVAQARADLEKAADSLQRVAALKRLATVAHSAGDAKTEAWALTELKMEAERTAQRQARKKASARAIRPQQALPATKNAPANRAPPAD